MFSILHSVSKRQCVLELSGEERETSLRFENVDVHMSLRESCDVCGDYVARAMEVGTGFGGRHVSISGREVPLSRAPSG